MCTLSLFRESAGYKVYMNRDERHDRARELSPQIISAEHSVIGPLDPVSNGTWIAYNENGYWGCLLNGYFEDNIDENKSYKSRGGILPSLLSHSDPLRAAIDLNVSDFPSFRLLIGSPHSHILLTWDGQKFAEAPFHASHQNRMFFLSSSSWEQDQVIDRRKGLFESWVANNPDGSDGIPDFHYLQTPNPESAPLMNRSYSGTKSITTLDVRPNNITMSYWRADNASIMEKIKA